MSTIRSILPSAIGISAIDVVLLLGHGYLAQLFPILVKTSDETVQVGSKVEVQFQLTPRDNPTTTYINTEIPSNSPKASILSRLGSSSG